MPDFYLCTFGCRCNQADSAGMRASLRRSSLLETSDARQADLIVVNSCTVTRRADQQVRQAVRRLHRENPEARIVVTGCYAERDPRTLAGIPGVSLVLGNADRSRISQLWTANREHGDRILRSPLRDKPGPAPAGAAFIGARTRPYVKLQDGCDARCAYCIVPFVRGAARSVSPEAVLEEIRSLVDQKFQEIVLTGIHLGAYGRKLPRPWKLAELLRQILLIPGLGRLRLSSIEPMDFDREIVVLAAENGSVARHFHIPLQSGSDRILRLMRRPYRAAQFLELLRHIHSHLPDAALGSDVLVGFPGETEADFEMTCEVIRSSPLAYLHVFPFSAREGTEAWSMPNPVPPPRIRERCETLRRLSKSINLEFRRRFIGSILPAVSLSRNEDEGGAAALSENFIHVHISGPPPPPNRLIDIRIREVSSDRTWAAIV
jgi:threonylcarbamoyladenosine tRNA methylthiotransferase MtaB